LSDQREGEMKKEEEELLDNGEESVAEFSQEELRLLDFIAACIVKKILSEE